MLPKIWIFDTYNLLIILGVIASLLILNIYSEKNKIDKSLKYTIAMIACITVVAGLVFAVLFQRLFDLIEGNQSRPFAMTFYGGLVGGAATFLVLYYFFVKKKYKDAKLIDLLIIAPASIATAHAFGRIGCFCAGCCYGIETDSWLGVEFPHDHNPRFPTQLFEAIFLFILAGILFYLAYKRNFKNTMPIYLLSYGVWRFLIEFIRGDDRGAFFLNLSPSQWFSIFGVLASLLLFIVIKRMANNDKKSSIKIA